MEENIKYRKRYYEANKQKIKENNLAYYHKMKITKEWQNNDKERIYYIKGQDANIMHNIIKKTERE